MTEFECWSQQQFEIQQIVKTLKGDEKVEVYSGVADNDIYFSILKIDGEHYKTFENKITRKD